jgi:hypothetical protein
MIGRIEKQIFEKQAKQNKNGKLADNQPLSKCGLQRENVVVAHRKAGNQYLACEIEYWHVSQHGLSQSNNISCLATVHRNFGSQRAIRDLRQPCICGLSNG